jgi:hypothetical protein
MSPNPEAVGISGPIRLARYPVFAESFRGVDHLCCIAVDAQALVNDTPATTLVDDDKS